jgi:hypothetical protein
MKPFLYVTATAIFAWVIFVLVISVNVLFTP